MDFLTGTPSGAKGRRLLETWEWGVCRPTASCVSQQGLSPAWSWLKANLSSFAFLLGRWWEANWGNPEGGRRGTEKKEWRQVLSRTGPAPRQSINTGREGCPLLASVGIRRDPQGGPSLGQAPVYPTTGPAPSGKGPESLKAVLAAPWGQGGRSQLVRSNLGSKQEPRATEGDRRPRWGWRTCWSSRQRPPRPWL